MKVKFIALGLCIIAFLACSYKVNQLGIPLLPFQTDEVWSIQARINFKAKTGPIEAEFIIPNQPQGFKILNEDFISSNYGLALDNQAENRTALWAIRRASGEQVLYYRLDLIPEKPDLGRQLGQPKPPYPAIPTDYDEPTAAAVNTILQEVRSRSANIISFTRELLIKLNGNDEDPNVSLINRYRDNEEEWVRTIVKVLAGARIPSRIVYILELKDRLSHGQLRPWMQVHNGSHWHLFNPYTAEYGSNSNILIWRYGDKPLAKTTGASPPKVEFSIAKHQQSQISVTQQIGQKSQSIFFKFSLLNLPIHIQNVYRIILLLPISAMIIVILRVFVGIKTFGTFMPVLMSLAFRETQLVWGITLFTMIVALGLMLRLYLEKLKLLLVPRLATVLTIVILLMSMISIVSAHLSLENGLSIALFPIVILTMVIERASIIWEERGPEETIKQGSGTIFAAALGYLVINNDSLEHILLLFPELLLVVIAFNLLLGCYSGYRITELWRFRHLIKEHKL